ncbi:TPA: hypothetical protein DDZ86_01860 [Candidatus Dependentiae bacterium]|nr:MAG: hypothetical protein UW09_C0001G0264 [candidate division TM6 bacterium GW2011_GWF2_43_87]HBL98370.1 hypothetical protein [Candidatus Dependentiae bacterium]
MSNLKCMMVVVVVASVITAHAEPCRGFLPIDDIHKADWIAQVMHPVGAGMQWIAGHRMAGALYGGLFVLALGYRGFVEYSALGDGNACNTGALEMARGVHEVMLAALGIVAYKYGVIPRSCRLLSVPASGFHGVLTLWHLLRASDRFYRFYGRSSEYTENLKVESKPPASPLKQSDALFFAWSNQGKSSQGKLPKDGEKRKSRKTFFSWWSRTV